MASTHSAWLVDPARVAAALPPPYLPPREDSGSDGDEAMGAVERDIYVKQHQVWDVGCAPEEGIPLT